jgi:hypothetical protein
MSNIKEIFDKMDKEHEQLSKELGEFDKEQIALYRDQAESTKEVVEFIANYKVKSLLFEYDNEIKSVDVVIDILKFIIPIAFSIWIASYSLQQLSRTTNFIIWVLSALIILMSITLWKRSSLTKKYIKLYKRNFESAKNRFHAVIDMKYKARVATLNSIQVRNERGLKILEKQGKILDELKANFQS